MQIFAESVGLSGVATSLGQSLSPRTPGTTVRYDRFLAATNAEGPGTRSAVWLQGCSVRCPGCFNPQLWTSRGGTVSNTSEVAAEWVHQAVAAGSEGITLLGGEPFDQAEAAAIIASAFHEAGLSVMSFSGYHLDQLLAWSAERDDIAALLASTDLLCDGPYLRDLTDAGRPWIGSRNQSIRALTDRYAADVAELASFRDRLEVRIAPDGTIAVNGWASDEQLASLFDDLGHRAPQSHRSATRLREESHESAL